MGVDCRMRMVFCLVVLSGCVPWSDTDLDGDGVAGGDCNDADPSIYPGAQDFRGDGVDDNCDGVDGTDRDGDGRASVQTGGLDCDDDNDTVYPTAPELCDGLDNDCDGRIDQEAIDARLWYVDVDGDTFGSSLEAPVLACLEPDPSRVADGSDCDDRAATVFPGATEQCGRDFDCDGEQSPCSALIGDRSDSAADWTFSGEEAGAFSGQSVGAVGDVNGDGYVDLAVGAPKRSGGGGVYIFLGPRGGGAALSVDLSEADAVILGEGSGGQGGVSLAGIGDVDGNGYDDLLIGANLQGGAGAAYVILGPMDPQSGLDAADAELIGEDEGSELGWAVAAAGDVDGDGAPDLLVSSPYQGTARRGAVYLVSAADIQTMSLADATVKFEGDVDGGWVGWDIAGNQDFDGDGLNDMLFGAPGSGTGRAYLEHGIGTGTGQSVKSLATSDAKWMGEVSGDEAGASVTFLGDVDGDGMADAAVGAPGAKLLGEEVGLVYVLSGGGNDWQSGLVGLEDAPAILAGREAGDRAGNTLAAAGDVDGDGQDDVLVSCVMCATRGAVYLVHGPISGEAALDVAATARLQGTTDGDLFGASLASLDWNADGYSDVLIGSPQGEGDPQGSGRALLFVGGDAP
jgi:hypothetical protein